MANRWDEAESLLIDCADADLQEAGEVQPALMAFAGATLRFIAWLRPFPKGRYHDPLTELLALAGPLDCDRLMLSLSGRAWPLDEPPPASAAGDERQRVVVVHVVDGTGEDVRSTSVLWPYDLVGGEVVWGQRRDMGEAPVGWISSALELAVANRDRMRAPLREVAAQARRAVDLGHELHLAEDLHLLLTEAAGAR